MSAYESLLAFWRDAGVDSCYLEEPFDHTIIQPLPTPAAVQKLSAVPTSPAVRGTTHPTQATAQARQLAAQAETLEALTEAVAGFDGCGLKHMGARQALFGRGNPDADLLVIGDAPSTDADAAAEAFRSPAGLMMDKILEAAQLADRTYLTHSVFWNPPGNRPPTPEEQAACLPFVERAVQLIRPKAVLLIGAVAVRGILGTDESLLRLQGQWRDWTTTDGLTLPAMVTFHPAFLLQQPQAKGLVWQSILSVCTRLS